MSGTVHRANTRSYEESDDTVIPANKNRTYFFIVFITGSGTIEFGGGGGLIPLANAAFYEPLVVPTSEISIASTGGVYVIHEG